jgi:hypothetical protein
VGRMIQVAVVSGAEGKSLQLWNKYGGKRIQGPKAWGNPFNKPLAIFTVDADELIKSIDRLAYVEGRKGEVHDECK